MLLGYYCIIFKKRDYTVRMGERSQRLQQGSKVREEPNEMASTGSHYIRVQSCLKMAELGRQRGKRERNLYQKEVGLVTGFPPEIPCYTRAGLEEADAGRRPGPALGRGVGKEKGGQHSLPKSSVQISG